MGLSKVSAPRESRPLFRCLVMQNEVFGFEVHFTEEGLEPFSCYVLLHLHCPRPRWRISRKVSTYSATKEFVNLYSRS